MEKQCLKAFKSFKMNLAKISPIMSTTNKTATSKNSKSTNASSSKSKSNKGKAKKAGPVFLPPVITAAPKISSRN